MPPITIIKGGTTSDFDINMPAIQSIFQSLGRAETLRRKQAFNTDLAKVLSRGGSPEEVNFNLSELISKHQAPQFDPGLSGVFQRIGSAFSQDPTQQLTQSLLRQALSPTGQPADLGVPGEPEPFDRAKEEKTRERDIKILTGKDSKGKFKASTAARKNARPRLRANKTLIDIPGGTDFSGFVKGKKKIKVGFLDKAFGEDAFNQALQEVKDQFLEKGISEQSAESEFTKWWDQQAETERNRGDRRFEFVPSSEFKGNIPDNSVRLTSAPDTRLTPIWNQLDNSQKRSILKAIDSKKLSDEDIGVIARKIQENPANITAIIQRL